MKIFYCIFKKVSFCLERTSEHCVRGNGSARAMCSWNFPFGSFGPFRHSVEYTIRSFAGEFRILFSCGIRFHCSVLAGWPGRFVRSQRHSFLYCATLCVWVRFFPGFSKFFTIRLEARDTSALICKVPRQGPKVARVRTHNFCWRHWSVFRPALVRPFDSFGFCRIHLVYFSIVIPSAAECGLSSRSTLCEVRSTQRFVAVELCQSSWVFKAIPVRLPIRCWFPLQVSIWSSTAPFWECHFLSL